MKQKRKPKNTARRKMHKVKILPPPIPVHNKLGFNSMGLYGETGSAHFAALPENETEGSILLRQAEHRGSEYAKKKTMKNMLFSIACGILAGFAAYFALSFALGIEGIVLYGASFIAFGLATSVAFGTSNSY